MSDEKHKEIETQEIRDNEKIKNDEKTRYIPVCLIWGIVFGTLLGFLLRNFAIWISLGVTLGILIGAVLDGKNEKNEK